MPDGRGFARLSELDEIASQYRKTIVGIVNILGAPGNWDEGTQCEGCMYENEEACLTGLISLGYLKRIDTLVEEGPPRVYDITYEPEPYEAWKKFMEAEFNFVIPQG